MGAPQIGGTVRNPFWQRLFSQLSHQHLEVRDVEHEPCVHSLAGGTVGRMIPLPTGRVLGWVSLQSLPQVLLSLVALLGEHWSQSQAAGISSMGHRWGRNLKIQVTAISGRKPDNSGIFKME